MNDNRISKVLGVMLTVALVALYLFGIYKIIADDHRYTTTDVVIGAVIFPYAWWVAVKEVYHLASTSSEGRQFEEKCLDDSQAIGLDRNLRLRYCACLVESRHPQMCKTKILMK